MKAPEFTLSHSQINRYREIEKENVRLKAENASLVALFKHVSDRVFPGHTDSVGAVREIVAENANLKVVVEAINVGDLDPMFTSTKRILRALAALEKV